MKRFVFNETVVPCWWQNQSRKFGIKTSSYGRSTNFQCKKIAKLIKKLAEWFDPRAHHWTCLHGTAFASANVFSPILDWNEDKSVVSLDHLLANSLPNNSVTSAIWMAKEEVDSRQGCFFVSSSTSLMAWVPALKRRPPSVVRYCFVNHSCAFYLRKGEMSVLWPSETDSFLSAKPQPSYIKFSMYTLDCLEYISIDSGMIFSNMCVISKLQLYGVAFHLTLWLSFLFELTLFIHALRFKHGDQQRNEYRLLNWFTNLVS